MRHLAQSRRRRSTRIIIALVLLASAGGVVAEVLLRALESGANGLPIQAQIEIADRIANPPFVPDPELGAVMKPSGQFAITTPDYSYTLRTDHAGFPNLDPWPKHVDIAVLGNSLIAGAGVGYEGQFTTLLEREFGAGTVLNFGVHGGGTEQQLREYRKFAAPLHPKLVIAVLWLTWEIDNSLKFRDWLDESGRPDFTTYSKTQRSVDPLEQVRGVLRRTTEMSYLLRVAHQASKTLRGLREPNVERVVLGNGDVIYLSRNDESRLMSGWRRPGTPDIHRVFFAPLEQLKAEVETGGARFLVVLVPSKEELYAATEFPDVLQPVLEARMELAARRIPTLDLYPVFAESAPLRPAFFRVDPHPNAFGHRIIAEALAMAINVDTDRNGAAPVKSKLPRFHGHLGM